MKIFYLKTKVLSSVLLDSIFSSILQNNCFVFPFNSVICHIVTILIENANRKSIKMNKHSIKFMREFGQISSVQI